MSKSPKSGKPGIRKVKFLIDSDQEMDNEDVRCAGGDAELRIVQNRQKSKRGRHNEEHYQEMQLSPNDPDRQALYKIFQKLSVAEQVVLHRTVRFLPDACSIHWRNTCRKLDFRVLAEELPVERHRNYMLAQMADHYRSVSFVAHRLQENLNILERAGVKSLNGVQRVELLLLEGEDSLPLELVKEASQDESHAGGDAKPKGVAQWPLHALPKLMKNVKRVKAQCDIQVHFVELFSDLELFILYGSISQSALTGIFERCHQLQRLFLKFNDRNHSQKLSLKAIRKCTMLRDLSVPVSLFNRHKELLIDLQQLHLLEMTHCDKNVPLAIECMRYVINQRAEAIEQVQLDCKCLAKKHVNWMQEVGLERCTGLRGLVLVNCVFGNREICQMTLPRVQKYIALISCKEIKEYQVLDMVRLCAGLRELYLIDCPQLTWRMLQGLYRIRRDENLSYPLTVVLGRCPTLRKDYQTMYSNYWFFKRSYIKIDRIQGESRPIEDIQIFFYQNPESDENLKPALQMKSALD